MRASRNNGPAAALLHAGLLAIALMTLVPFVWLLCATLKQPGDFFAYTFLPWDHLNNLTLENYRELFRQEPFALWMINSLFLASTYTVAVVTFSSLGGFALAKYRFAGRRPL